MFRRTSLSSYNDQAHYNWLVALEIFHGYDPLDKALYTRASKINHKTKPCFLFIPDQMEQNSNKITGLK